MARVSRDGFWRLFGFFLEAKNAKSFIYFGHTELIGKLCSHLKERDGNVCLSLLMVVDKQAVVHLINMVTRKDQYVSWSITVQKIKVLTNGIGGTSIPIEAHSLLRRNYLQEVAQLLVENVPAVF